MSTSPAETLLATAAAPVLPPDRLDVAPSLGPPLVAGHAACPMRTPAPVPAATTMAAIPAPNRDHRRGRLPPVDGVEDGTPYGGPPGPAPYRAGPNPGAPAKPYLGAPAAAEPYSGRPAGVQPAGAGVIGATPCSGWAAGVEPCCGGPEGAWLADAGPAGSGPADSPPGDLRPRAAGVLLCCRRRCPVGAAALLVCSPVPPSNWIRSAVTGSDSRVCSACSENPLRWLRESCEQSNPSQPVRASR